MSDYLLRRPESLQTRDPDKATVAFVVATAALGSGKNTMVFLSTDGVWAGVKEEAAKVDEGSPFQTVHRADREFPCCGRYA